MTDKTTTPDPAPAWPPMRFVGWSVDRVDGSSTMGTFDRRETADEWCERLRGYGNDVHVVRYEVPDEMAVLSGLLRGMARRQVRTRQIGDQLAESYDEHVDLLGAALERSGWTAGTSINALRKALDGDAAATPQPDAEMADLYETARLSVLHGVTWTGTTESAGGVSKDDALTDAAALLQEIERRGGLPAIVRALATPTTDTPGGDR